MQQVVVVTSNQERAQKAFDKKDFYITWCPVQMEEIIKNRARSNVFFFCIYDDDPEILKKIGLYLRDLCIDEEKILYIYGSREGVDVLKSCVPSLYIRKSAYFFACPLEDLTNDLYFLDKIRNKQERSKRVLIMDDDDEYISKLRLHLDTDFQVFVCPYDLTEAGTLILHSDILLIGTTGRFTLPESIDLLRIISRRRKYDKFHAYYLAVDDAERKRLNISSIDNNIAFSKEMEMNRIVSYLKDLK
ncbi:MAG: hypothetical protein K5668_01360 [Lachnospiraceae bacterium]|nr:hypothetical protein [Lachnospiraceae bacterium]